ncbi:MAG: hypothetical protein AABY04_00145 [Candidatus Micrarchaeota archaeon]
MRYLQILLISGLMIFLSGCVSLSYHQKVSADGSSLIIQTTDASALTNLQNQTALFGSDNLFNTSASLKPENKAYDKAKYDLLPTPESLGITMKIQSRGPITIGGYYPSVQATISNNANITLRDVEFEMDSNAFEVSGNYGNFFGTIKPDEFKTYAPMLTLLDVKPGNHLLTVILKFKDGTGKEVVLAKTEQIEIEARATPTPSPATNYNKEFEKQCDEIRKSGSECTYSEGKVVASKKYTLENNFYTFKVVSGFPNIKYEIEVFKLPVSNLSSSGSTGMPDYDIYKRLDDAGIKKTASILKLAGMEINYKVEMPGKITKAEGGTISNNIAKFDVIEMMENGKTIKVTSEELNVPYVAGAAILFLILIIVIWKFVLKKPKSAAPIQMQTSSYPPVQNDPNTPLN